MLRAGADELVGVEAERTQDRRRDLLVLDHVINRTCFEARVGGDQQDVGIVVGESAMLGDLRCAFAVDRAVDWLDDDVGRAAQGRVAERLFRLPGGIDLLDRSLVQESLVVLEDGDGLFGLGLIGQPDQRDVVGSLLRHLDAAGGQEVDRVDNVGMAGQQSRIGAALQHVKLAHVDRRLAMLGTNDHQGILREMLVIQLREHLAERVVDEVERLLELRARCARRIGIAIGRDLLADADGLEVHAEIAARQPWSSPCGQGP